MAPYTTENGGEGNVMDMGSMYFQTTPAFMWESGKTVSITGTGFVNGIMGGDMQGNGDMAKPTVKEKKRIHRDKHTSKESGRMTLLSIDSFLI